MMDNLPVDSLFVESFSLALLHFLWQGCVVTSLAAAGFVLLSRSANVRYVWGTACLALMAACPIVTFYWFYLQSGDNRITVTSDFVTITATSIVPRVASEAVGIETLTDLVRSHGLWQVAHLAIVSVWFVAQFFSGCRLIVSAYHVYRLKRWATPVQQDLRCVAERLARRMGVRCPHIASSQHTTGAIAAGFYRQVVIVPAAWLTDMSPEMLEAVIAHELAHVRRYDLWINLFQRLVESVLFFHPAVWWLSGRIRQDRELCCDLLAVRATKKRKLYAETLEHVARLGPARNTFLATQIGGDRMSLLRRVRSVLGQQTSSTALGWWPAGMLAIAILCSLIGFSHSIPSLARAMESSGTDPKVSLSVSVSNSKFCYIVTEGGGEGDSVARLPVTGNETVLDAIAQLGGVSQFSNKRLYIRRLSAGGRVDQVLPIDLDAITLGKATATDYQLLPGDRLFVTPVVHNELITCAYDIGDLVLPIGTIRFSETGEQTRAENAKADFDTLATLIQATIAPDGWEEVGGSGSLTPFEGNLSLVVSQTQGVHDQIAELLTQQRRLQETKVTLHARVLELPPNVTKELGLHGKRLAALTAREQELVLRAADQDPHARVYPGLKANLFNGQVMPMKVEDDLVLSIQSFVEGDRMRVAADLMKSKSTQAISSMVLTGDQALLVRMPSVADRADRMLFRLITAEVAKANTVR